MNFNKPPKIHPTSIIDSNTSIGEDTTIWHWVHVSENVVIGKSCTVGQNVYIGKNVQIGSNVKIQNNVSVYENVYLEDYVFCGPSMVFTNVINPRSEIDRKNEFKKTIVKKGATIGANATIICGNTIGKYAFIAAGSVITKNVKDFALMMGNPAKQVGWMSAFGQKFILPQNNLNKWICPQTGDIYELKNDEIMFTSNKK